ncbi:hypothetical protein ACFY2G_04185 [Streptomyces collinus]|uniref:zinc finger domain-containing protein n=1 Tax=Streptomyces collinus TaxID=42684 RepID=UPI003685B001
MTETTTQPTRDDLADTVICPACRAGRGARCITRSGKPARDWHGRRIDALEQAAGITQRRADDCREMRLGVNHEAEQELLTAYATRIGAHVAAPTEATDLAASPEGDQPTEATVEVTHLRPLNPQQSADRCPAAHPDDPSPCRGPVVVTILDRDNAGADGCEHHAVRLLASLDGGRPVGKPDAPAGIALRVFRLADRTRPFAWRGESR